MVWRGDNGRVSAVLMQQGSDDLAAAYLSATGSTEIDRLSDVDTAVMSLTVWFTLGL
jgi:hypothetical protein